MGVSDTADTKLNTTHQNQISSIQIQIGDKTGKYLLKINKKRLPLRKNCFFVILKNLCTFKAEDRESAISLRLLEQFIQTVKVQNNFW